MKKIKTFLFAFSTAFFIFGCKSEKVKPVPYSHYADFDFDHGLFNTQTVIEGNDAHSGTKYSRAATGNNFGIGYSYPLPDSLKGKSVSVAINAWVRTGDITNSNDIIVSITQKDSILLWVNCNFKEFIKAPNEWTDCKRVINFPKEILSFDNIIINVMAHNIDAKTFFDVDDLTIHYFESDSLNTPDK